MTEIQETVMFISLCLNAIFIAEKVIKYLIEHEGW